MYLRTVVKSNLRKLSAISNFRRQQDSYMKGMIVGPSLQTTFWRAKMTAGWNTARNLKELCLTRLSWN